jgi:hypothetical protein
VGIDYIIAAYWVRLKYTACLILLQESFLFIYLFILAQETLISWKEINTDKLITDVKVDKGSRHESTIAHEVMISSTGNIAPPP